MINQLNTGKVPIHNGIKIMMMMMMTMMSKNDKRTKTNMDDFKLLGRSKDI